MQDKTSWFIRVSDSDRPEMFGVGECGPLPGLSVDHKPDYEETLSGFLDQLNRSSFSTSADVKLDRFVPPEYPSVIFGLETALRDFQNGGKGLIFDNSFVQGKSIPINGLVWMGDMDFMMDQINKKIAQGFRCLKLKVGGLDFDRECDILTYIRRRYFRENIIIRLDANGAFKIDDVLYKLGEMAKFDIHSIEQPIKPGQEEMEELCRKSPIPVAFDEEIISVFSVDAKSTILKKLKPAYIVLKPTLHGGLQGCDEWIRTAEGHNIGWWITSALESSVGLNAICQFTANYAPTMPQGLGTGAIYSDNFPSPLTVKEGAICWNNAEGWKIDL